MSAWLARVIVRVSAWLAEIDARENDTGCRFSPGAEFEKRHPVSFSRALGAPWDALLLRVRGWSGPQLRSGWLTDLRDAFRALRKAPMQTATVLLCLVIGSTLTVLGFGLVNTITGGALPGVRDRDRLVKIAVEAGYGLGSLTTADYLAIPDTVPGLDSISAEQPWIFAVVVDGHAGLIDGRYVSGAYFDVLGTEPAAGRLLRPADDRADALPVAVIGHGLWMTSFGGRADVVGSPIQLGGRRFTVVGVAPPGFVGLKLGDADETVKDRAQVFVAMAQTASGPLQLRSSLRPGMSIGPQVTARLAPGLSRAEAERLAQGLAARFNAARAATGASSASSPYAGTGIRAVRFTPATLLDGHDASDSFVGLSIVMAVPILILILACANVAGVQLVRALRRTHELAIRVSLGAARARVVRLLVLETAMVAALAGAIAWGLGTQILRLSANVMPVVVTADARVFAMSLLLPMAVTIVAGLAPAWRATGFDVLAGLRSRDGGGSFGRGRLRRATVVAQLVLSVALLTVSMFAVRELEHVPESVGPLQNDVLVAEIRFRDLGIPADRERLIRDELFERVRHLPGVTAAAIGEGLFANTHSHIDGEGQGQADSRVTATEGQRMGLAARRVTGEFFQAQGLKVLQGRSLSPADAAGVAVVNKAFMDRLARPEDVIGLPIRTAGGGRTTSAHVIGVVENGYERAVVDRRGEPVVYVPLDRVVGGDFAIYLRGHDVGSLVPMIRKTCGDVHPQLAATRLGTIADLMRDHYLGLYRLSAALGVITGLALVLAGIGLFGTVSQSSAQRTYEFGVRLALGARRQDVAWMIVRAALMTSLLGLVGGLLLVLPLAGAFGVFRLYEVGYILSPLPLVAIAGTLALLAMAASFAPARRVMAIDPVKSLRSE